MARKILTPIASAVVIVGLYAAAGYLGVPAGVKWALDKYAVPALGGSGYTVESISFNPWSLQLSIDGLAIHGPSDRDAKLLSLNHLFADLSASTISQRAPIIEAINVDGLNVHLVQPENSLSGAKQESTKTETTTSTSGLPAFSLSNVTMTNSSVRFTNTKERADVVISDINFKLPIISTLPTASKATVTPSLSLKIDGTPIKASGKTDLENAELAIKINDLNIARVLKALPISLPARLEKGIASADLKLKFAINDVQNGAVQVKGSIGLKDLDVRDPHGARFVSAQSILADINTLDVASRLANIDTVAVVAPSLYYTIEKTNKGASQTTANASNGKSDDTAWKWKIGNAQIANGAVHLSDASLKPAAKIDLTAITLNASGFASDARKPGKYNLSARLGQGLIQSSGSLSLLPLSANATTNLENLHLATFNPWIRNLAGASLQNGVFTANGQLAFKQKDKLDVSWQGDASVKNFEAKDAKGSSLMSWKAVSATKIRLDSIEPLELGIGQIDILQPAQKATQKTSQVLGLFGAIAKATGHDRTAGRLDKVEKTITQDIHLKNVIYRKGQFSINGKGTNTLEKVAVDLLNRVFAKQN